MGLPKFIADFKAGTLSREDFWTKMREAHLSLTEYCELLQGNRLDHIEINQRGARHCITEWS